MHADKIYKVKRFRYKLYEENILIKKLILIMISYLIYFDIKMIHLLKNH